MKKRLILAGVAIAGLALLWWGGLDMQGVSKVAGPVAGFAPGVVADAQKGEALFSENCATCHGDSAAGKDGAGPPLVHKIYEPSHHADGAFYLAVSKGVRAHHWPYGDMPPVAGVKMEEVAHIVAYVRGLQKQNGIF